MVDLELYRIFKTVADEENLTRASEKLNISQPAVTKHIHNLEDELKLKLFYRTQYGMKLTVDGEKIYNQKSNPLIIVISLPSPSKIIKSTFFKDSKSLYSNWNKDCQDNAG